jgi:hypothetical protein
VTQSTHPITEKRSFHLSLDTWAVLVALAAALLIRAGIIPRVPW